MKIANVCTSSLTCSNPHSMRAEIDGWGFEDSALYVPNKPIGRTPSPHERLYKTVLEMLADGWKLMAPPTVENYVLDNPSKGVDPNVTQYVWWLSKDS